MWLTDVTEHPTSEGKVYCAAVMDVYSRRIVGWSIAERGDTAIEVRVPRGLAALSPSRVKVC